DRRPPRVRRVAARRRADVAWPVLRGAEGGRNADPGEVAGAGAPAAIGPVRKSPPRRRPLAAGGFAQAGGPALAETDRQLTERPRAERPGRPGRRPGASGPLVQHLHPGRHRRPGAPRQAARPRLAERPPESFPPRLPRRPGGVVLARTPGV